MYWILDEPLQITYSYWDGTGHRRVIQVCATCMPCIICSTNTAVSSSPDTTFLQVRKGDTIGAFLRAVQQQLAPEFREVRTASVENLLYVKEDLIIPHVTYFCFFFWIRSSFFFYPALDFLSHFYFPVLQQHSFYEMIINKARGKSGPVIISFLM